MKANNKFKWNALMRSKIGILLFFVTTLSLEAQDDSLPYFRLDLYEQTVYDRVSFIDTVRIDSSEVSEFAENYIDSKKIGPNDYFQIVDYQVYEDELVIISRENSSGICQIIWRSFVRDDDFSYLSMQDKVVLGHSPPKEVRGLDITIFAKQIFIDYSKCESFNVKKLLKTDFKLIIISNSQFEVKSKKVVTASFGASFGLEYKFCQKLVETTEIVSLEDIESPFLPIDRSEHFEYYCDCQ